LVVTPLLHPSVSEWLFSELATLLVTECEPVKLHDTMLFVTPVSIINSKFYAKFFAKPHTKHQYCN
jgi:hypothetical protein